MLANLMENEKRQKFDWLQHFFYTNLLTECLLFTYMTNVILQIFTFFVTSKLKNTCDSLKLKI